MPASKVSYLPYHQRSRRRWLFGVGLVATAFLVGMFAGIIFWEFVGHRAAQAREVLAHRLLEAESIITQLKRQNTVFENASRVDQLAVQNTRKDLQALEDKLLDTEKELEFYRRIVSPKHRNDELRILRFRMFQTGQIALTLSQGVAREGSLQASARIQFNGRLNGKETMLAFKDVDRDRRNSLAFSFRYFQTRTANTDFPEGFELDSVQVTATPDISEKTAVSKTWSAEEIRSHSGISISKMGDFEILN